MEAPLSRETLAAQAMGAVDSETGALVPPVHPGHHLRDACRRAP